MNRKKSRTFVELAVLLRSDVVWIRNFEATVGDEAGRVSHGIERLGGRWQRMTSPQQMRRNALLDMFIVIVRHHVDEDIERRFEKLMTRLEMLICVVFLTGLLRSTNFSNDIVIMVVITNLFHIELHSSRSFL